jgi:hypothetical protein
MARELGGSSALHDVDGGPLTISLARQHVQQKPTSTYWHMLCNTLERLPMLPASPTESEEEEGEGALTGVDNKLGLGLSFDDTTSTVHAPLLKSEIGDEAKLDCSSLSDAAAITGAGSRENAPPRVAKDLIDLVKPAGAEPVRANPFREARFRLRT